MWKFNPPPLIIDADGGNISGSIEYEESAQMRIASPSDRRAGADCVEIGLNLSAAQASPRSQKPLQIEHF